MANKKPDQTRILTKEEIWAADDIVTEFVPVSQWGRKSDGTPKGVMIRSFSKRQVSDFNKQSTRRDRVTGKDVTDNEMVEALLFTEGVIEPKFALDDYERLQEKSVAALVTIIKAINAISGLSDEAVADADKSNGEGPQPPIRVLPRARAKDDAGGTTDQNVSP